ncbi:uncharacterized protein LOC100374962 [Saccoglossus kowalevskii]|uniref:Uncharacterized protein LOC100374962 n=1 Tax=Saccoglossus kowalevskii TaxID=10224 RepID=A0ABM0GJ73_SACKO|nr:PREDICTED: uncharacterized protein LOC100374962 [Saccoglossus kowalevskii]
MAAHCCGSFGAYKHLYSRHQDLSTDGLETVWVSKRFIPTDLRSTAPVPKHKPMVSREYQQLPSYWVPLGEPSLKVIDRGYEEREIYASQPSTRSEEWSSLRQILPSRGTCRRGYPPNWGTGIAVPPPTSPYKETRFPHINSPMTRYVDHMHQTNRLFKLH